MTTNILKRIANSNRELVRERATCLSVERLAAMAHEAALAEGRRAETSGQGGSDKQAPSQGSSKRLGQPFAFRRALSQPGMSFICECKKASPSKGVIAHSYDPTAISHAYSEAGASAISVLTEPRWFQGSMNDLKKVSANCDLPTLRKDFIVDPYQIFEAKISGASAVLLICSILTDSELATFIELAESLGMDALVEAYEPQDVPRALAAGARIVGVNNRDLRTFEVDFGRSIALRKLVGPERLFVSESGVGTRADVARLEEAGVDAVLIGETLMRATDPAAMLRELRGR